MGICLVEIGLDRCITRKKMSPSSVAWGANIGIGGKLIAPASCDVVLVPGGKCQEEDLSSTNLEQWRYNTAIGYSRMLTMEFV